MSNIITKSCLDCGKKFSYNNDDFCFPTPKPVRCESCCGVYSKNMRFKRCLEEIHDGIRDDNLVTANKKELECLAKAILKQNK